VNFPTINAPDGNGGSLSGPQLNVVPATPVSGGGAADPAAVPFQATLESLHQGESATASMLPESVINTKNHISLGVAQPTWNVNPQPEQPMFNFPPTQSPHPPTASLAPASDYLLSNNLPRIRSHSDGNMAPPQGLFTMPLEDDSAVFDDSMNSHIMFTPGSSPASTTSFHTAMNGGHNVPHPQRPPHMAHNYTFGPPSSTAAHLGPAGPSNSTGLSPHLGASMMLGGSPHLTPNQLPGQGQFLSPMDAAMGGGMLRRARSDGGRGHRQVRSEDFGNFAPGAPQEFPQFLAPDMSGIGGIAARGHMRRASSGSRSDRGVGAMPGGMIGGMWGGSARSSPYPSPNASPRGPIDSIPLPDVSVRRGQRPSALGMDDNLAASSKANVLVQKQNVTTHATKDASEKRRKVEAAFTCPVPGCGSTFTRHFNLKGA
jgi:transcription factor CRZ1